VKANMDKHYEKCLDFILTCPQVCSESLFLARRDVNEHIEKTCGMTVISCPFANLGCGYTIKRCELHEHSKTFHIEHSILVIKQIEEFKNSIDILTEENKKLRLITQGPAGALKNTSQSQSQSHSLTSPPNFSQNGNHNSIKNYFTTNGPSYTNQNTIPNNTSILPNNNVKPTNSLLIKKRGRPPKDKTDQFYNFGSGSNDKNKFDSRMSNNSNSETDNENSSINNEICLKNLPLLIDLYSNGVQVVENRALCVSQNKNEHNFVFADMILNSPPQATSMNTQIWKVTVLRRISWMAFGMANKCKVLENNFKFKPNVEGFDHGCWCLSNNGYLWNCSNEVENSYNLSGNFEINTGEEIIFKYSEKTSNLEISIRDEVFFLNNVQSSEGILLPCVIFMGYYDEVMFTK
jgi:hypothetical protein